MKTVDKIGTALKYNRVTKILLKNVDVASYKYTYEALEIFRSSMEGEKKIQRRQAGIKNFSSLGSDEYMDEDPVLELFHTPQRERFTERQKPSPMGRVALLNANSEGTKGEAH